MVKKIYSRNWDFTLYKMDDKLVISIVFFGMVDYHRSFYLLTDEINNGDYESLKDLSENIRNNYDRYKSREIVPAILSET